MPEIESAKELLDRLRNLEPAARAKPLKVFIDYSHEDEKLKNELASYLEAADLGASIEFIGLSESDLSVPSVGTAIRKRMASADIILVLLSAHSIPLSAPSEYMLDAWGALARSVVPIILSPFESQSRWTRFVQCLPQGARPVTDWPHREDTYRDIVEGLRVIITRLREGGLDDSPRDDTEAMLKVLAHEYEDLRKRINSGPERTRLMEGVARRMQELAAHEDGAGKLRLYCTASLELFTEGPFCQEMFRSCAYVGEEEYLQGFSFVKGCNTALRKYIAV
ncbi:MAG: hypothetical protein ABW208_25640 [Pyrinomonadaceae bacterium]